MTARPALKTTKIVKVAKPEDDTDGANKSYVDEQISALMTEITAPAKLEWLTMKDNKAPNTGYVNLSSANIDSDFIYISLTSQNGAAPFKGFSGTKTMYEYASSGGLDRTCMSISSWYWEGAWKWKGTAEIKRITLHDNYIKVETRDSGHRWSNGDFANEAPYRFTISGLF